MTGSLAGRGRRALPSMIARTSLTSPQGLSRHGCRPMPEKQPDLFIRDARPRRRRLGLKRIRNRECDGRSLRHNFNAPRVSRRLYSETDADPPPFSGMNSSPRLRMPRSRRLFMVDILAAASRFASKAVIVGRGMPEGRINAVAANRGTHARAAQCGVCAGLVGLRASALSCCGLAKLALKRKKAISQVEPD